mmetsp:Transcript_14368/g.50436  ORF Transcript_14368/g.50436 Transcript_14368/m.50436 type:complete len:224 (-) Transcript_14368:144-815(-)
MCAHPRAWGAVPEGRTPVGALAWAAQYASARTREDQFAAVPLAPRVVVKEIAVETCLDEAADPADPIHVVLCEVAIDPIQNVEGPIGAQATDEVRGQILDLSPLLHQHQLGNDGHALEPDGHGPQTIRNAVLLCEDQAQQSARAQEVQLVLEIVVGPLICLADRGLVPNHVNQVDRCRDEDDLHHSVVDRDEAPQQIQVAAAEHYRIHLLHPARHPDTTFALL